MKIILTILFIDKVKSRTVRNFTYYGTYSFVCLYIVLSAYVYFSEMYRAGCLLSSHAVKEYRMCVSVGVAGGCSGYRCTPRARNEKFWGLIYGVGCKCTPSLGARVHRSRGGGEN